MARLKAGQVQVHYEVNPGPRSADQAVRAVHLLLHHLATRTTHRSAALHVQPGAERAAAVAGAAGFRFGSRLGGGGVHNRSVPPLTYTDGVVTIRRQRVEDIDQHLAAIDDDQIDWLWEPGDRREWEALTPPQQREHNLRHLAASHESFGAGPKWAFSADTAGASYVAYVDCDLASNSVPAGQANISYAGHPAYRGEGNVGRAVRLVIQFLRDHTGAQSAHIVVDAQNTASLRVARAVGAQESERWVNEHGRTMIRHVRAVR